MGTGSICFKKEKFNVAVQYPSIGRPSTTSPLSFDSVPAKPSLENRTMVYPVEDRGFKVNKNPDHYSLIWDENIKVTNKEKNLFFTERSCQSWGRERWLLSSDQLLS